jgi:short subunit dehydrogenase-like uncharacterized protein
MAGRIVLFGATGYTGDLTARAMVRRGLRPVLAGRGAKPLEALAQELGGLEVVLADAERPDTVRALVERGDVLVSTVGPFAERGGPAVEAAVDAGAHYLDCSGEPRFIRGVFERHGPRAQAVGCALLTAFGYDWLPGNLAGALALTEAGEAAASVEIGYYAPGIDGTTPLTAGTRATLAGIMVDPAYAWRAGQLVTVPSASKWRTFELPSGCAEAISVGGTEHIALPRFWPGLLDVEVYIGWMGRLSRATQAFMLAGSLAAEVPGFRAGMRGLVGVLADGSSGGPDAEMRARTRSVIVAEARNRAGTVLADVRLEGVDPYELSARLLAWGAETARDGKLQGAGALGPVEAVGLEVLEAEVAELGLARA